MTLHRTPVHTRALRDVQDGLFEWRDSVGVSGGFTGRAGLRLEPPVLVALYELRNAGLLTVEQWRVEITPAGVDALRRWTNQQSTVFARSEVSQ